MLVCAINLTSIPKELHLMILQHLSQMNDRFAQRLTAGLLVIQAAIATTAISAFATQPVFAQDVQPKAQAAQLFETKQMSTAAKALSPQATACWTNAASQNCSYTISPTHPLSLELPKPNQLNTATVAVPATAATCWTSATPQACSYTISLSPADRITPILCNS